MSRPLLAIDVDGVISLFGFDEPPARDLARFELIDGSAVAEPLANTSAAIAVMARARATACRMPGRLTPFPSCLPNGAPMVGSPATSAGA